MQKEAVEACLDSNQTRRCLWERFKVQGQRTNLELWKRFGLNQSSL